MSDFEKNEYTPEDYQEPEVKETEISSNPQLNPVNYTPIKEEDATTSHSIGLKIFALIMAMVIALSVVIAAGYVYGRNSVTGRAKNVNQNLAARPKNTDQYTAAQVYERINKSIVGIRVYSNAVGRAVDASGVFYTETGYIVTNDHIYSEIESPRFKIYTYDGTEFDAEYVAGDIVSDLAVLRIVTDKDIKFQVPEFGNSAEIVCGEGVVAIGRPSSATDDSSVTSGIISLPKRRMQTASNYSASLIQTDSAINPGSSGGALVNMYGQIIGITASKLAGVQYDLVGFAIPTVTVKRVVEQLIKDGKVTNRAKLGITYKEIDSVAAEINAMPYTGLYIDSVSEDSDIYGKVKKGDIITHINGLKIVEDDIVLDFIEDSFAGDVIKLTVVFADGTSRDFEVKLKANIGESSYIE